MYNFDILKIFLGHFDAGTIVLGYVYFEITHFQQRNQ